MSRAFGQMKTGNPAFAALSGGSAGTVFEDWARTDARPTTMTVTGTSVKALILLAIAVATAAVAWTQMGQQSVSGAVLIGSLIGGTILAFATMFKPTWAPVTAPLYAACEGFFLGAISNVLNSRFPGIAAQAVAMTFGVTFLMLFLYTSRTIRVTPRLTKGIIAATGAIFLVYMVSFVLQFFGIQVPYIHGAGPIGIAFSVFVVGLAAFNLLLDFDFIEAQSDRGAPKTMEWYGAFALMVTLVWLYLEVLRLLAKLQSNRD